MLISVCVASNSSLAQEFEDDPFFENEEFGLGGSDDFQDSEFGSTDGFLEPGLAEDDDPFAPMNEEGETYIDEESFDLDAEQALQIVFLPNVICLSENDNRALQTSVMVQVQG